jgi:uncharacterized iron-regulated membrane protein
VTLRPWIFWPHLIAGVTAGAVILVMSVTGVLLTYERQLITWSDREFRSTPPAAGARPLDVDALLAAARRLQPDVELTGITLRAGVDDPVAIAAGQRTFYLDAYTGQLLGDATQGMRRFMSELRGWHRWLAVEGEGRPLARAITGWSNLLFLFVVVTGMYLWLPRVWSWRHVRTVALFSGGLRGKARDFNWHNVIGIWSAIPLFIVVLSAVPISFPWGTALVYRAVGEEPPARGGGGEGRRGGGPGAEGRRGGGAGPEGRRGGGEGQGERASRERRIAEPRDTAQSVATSFDRFIVQAGSLTPDWRSINLRLPASERAPVVVAIDRGDGGQPQLRETVTFAQATGAVTERERFADQSPGRRLRSLMRFGHTGEVLGIPGQTVAGIATAGSVVLVWTGIALSLRRLRAWLSRRRRREAPAVAARSSAA